MVSAVNPRGYQWVVAVSHLNLQKQSWLNVRNYWWNVLHNPNKKARSDKRFDEEISKPRN